MPSYFTSSLGPTQMADAGGLPQLTQVRTYSFLECLKCEQQSGKDVKNSVLWADIFKIITIKRHPLLPQEIVKFTSN